MNIKLEITINKKKEKKTSLALILYRKYSTPKQKNMQIPFMRDGMF